jgi:hypothetical protein
VPSVVRDVLASPGRPLDPSVRRTMENSLGHDFGDVRVRTDARAAAAARAIGARAYTAGADVVFGADRFAPHTAAGRQLLAHELAHVVRQRQAPAPLIQRQPEDPGNEGETTTKSEVRGSEIHVTETLVRDGLESRLVTVFDPARATKRTRLFRRSVTSPGWTDVTDQAIHDVYLNPPGVEPGTVSIEWNMPAARPHKRVGSPAEIVSEMIVSELPPSLVIPYVKDSVLTEHFEFTPPGENPYQHWADTIGRRWSATGARKTNFWLNKVVTAASLGVAVGGVVTNAGKVASAAKVAAEAERRAFNTGVRALKSFDLGKSVATNKEMVAGVRELETGLKRGLPGTALDEAAHQLTDLQRRGLQENVRRVITKTIQSVREGKSGVASVVAQVANPRFRFLRQVPGARAALVDALKTIGVELPNGW